MLISSYFQVDRNKRRATDGMQSWWYYVYTRWSIKLKKRNHIACKLSFSYDFRRNTKGCPKNETIKYIGGLAEFRGLYSSMNFDSFSHPSSVFPWKNIPPPEEKSKLKRGKRKALKGSIQGSKTKQPSQIHIPTMSMNWVDKRTWKIFIHFWLDIINTLHIIEKYTKVCKYYVMVSAWLCFKFTFLLNKEINKALRA